MATTLLFIIISIAGLCTLQSAMLKQFEKKPIPRSFLDAQRLCRNTLDDLATFTNAVENSYVTHIQAFESYVWIGLYDNMSSWTWSLDRDDFDNGIDFSNWHSSEPQLTIIAKICVYMSPGGLWFDELCTVKLPAVCYYEPGPAKYILVTIPMTWSDAQLYCYYNYTGLASVRNQSENQNISSLLTGPSWIGLYRQGWAQWSDRTILTYNNFQSQDLALNQTSTEHLICARANTNTGEWSKASCEIKYESVCQGYVIEESIPVTEGTGGAALWSKRVFKLRLQSDPDLNDPCVQGQLLRQLRTNLAKHGLTEVTLRWIQYDGQVFQKQTPSKDKQGF